MIYGEACNKLERALFSQDINGTVTQGRPCIGTVLSMSDSLCLQSYLFHPIWKEKWSEC